ncbi:hypothetical protein [Kribbella sp. NPDC023855]|uniref:hypothetical protein n=1 Tax=Kribbella sp. NPDC023855 TaxID=3154698 RepID=UPI0033FC6ED5
MCIQARVDLGNDPLHFDDLNGGKPILYSALGEGGVGDPHIVRSPKAAGST